MHTLRLPHAVYDSLRRHGEEAYPEECCGILLGVATPAGWSIDCSIRTANARAGSGRSEYEIAPAELVAIAHQARKRGLEIAGFYHSHPDHPAEWSATDLAEAHWLGCCYAITEVMGREAVRTCSFLLAGRTEEEKHFELQQIEIVA